MKTKKRGITILLLSIGIITAILTSCTNTGISIVNVDTTSNNQNLLNDNVDIVNMIALDNNHPVGEIAKMVFFNKNYILLDKSAKKLVVFNSDGSFNYEIFRLGKGEEEYASIQNFYIDSNNETINIISTDAKILTFSIQGRYISTYIDKSPNSFVIDCSVTDKYTASYHLGPNHNLTMYDKNHKVVYDSQPFDEMRDYTFSTKAFSEMDRSILFAYGGNDTIYSISQNSQLIKPAYFINFGSASIDPKLYKEDPSKIESLYSSRSAAVHIDDLNESTDHLIFSYLLFDPQNPKGVSVQNVIYNKKSKVAINLMAGTVLFPVKDIDNEDLISLVSPDMIIDDSNFIFNNTKESFIKEHSLTIDSNPVIVRWSCK